MPPPMYLPPTNTTTSYYAAAAASAMHPYVASQPMPMPAAMPLPAQMQPPPTNDFVNMYSSTYQAQPRGALADTTSTVVNSVQQNTTVSSLSRGTKRGRAGCDNERSKRPRTEVPTTSEQRRQTGAVPVPGAGPISTSKSANVGITSSNSQGSLLASNDNAENHANASHVWYFTRGVHSSDKPTTPLPKEKPTRDRPKEKEFLYLACTLCDYPNKWTTWKNRGNSNRAVFRHLDRHHNRLWHDIIVIERLKGWKNIESSSGKKRHIREDFTLEGFYQRLLRWIAVDDQSLNVVDCNEFRDLLLYLGEDLEDSDIPHRSKLGELITAAFKKQYGTLINRVQNSLGRVSFTTDTWSRTNLESYMAVTAHYIIKDKQNRNKLQSDLVAFRIIHGSHSGNRLGKEFVEVLKGIGCLERIGMVTADNASNNNTMMDEIAEELEMLNIPFHRDGNRIRCFPHVINLAVGAALDALANPPNDFPQPNPPLPPGTTVAPEEEEEAEARHKLAYQSALQSNLVGRVRSLVTAVRASGQRREAFLKTIEDGNKDGGFGDPSEELRVVILLKDVRTRWSSIFKMIDRFLELYPACKMFVSEDWDLIGHDFSDVDILVLTDIRYLLYVFHMVQEIVSGERTPTLSLVLPLYEDLVSMLSDLSKAKPQLAHAIESAKAKLTDYLDRSRRTPMYALTIVLNPTVKFAWIKEHWTGQDYEGARAAVADLLLEYQRQRQPPSGITPESNSLTTPSRKSLFFPSASPAALNLTSGLSRLQAFRSNLAAESRHLDEPDTHSHSDDEEDPEDESSAIEEQNRKAVDDELAAYESEGCVRGEELADFDIMRYWQERQFKYPLLYKAGLDALPVQASAVPCERVFSSSKETDTLRRASLEDKRMQELQVLKFMFRNDRLNFTDDLICSEHELSVIDLDPEIVEELIASGRVSELNTYIDESWNRWNAEGDLRSRPDDTNTRAQSNHPDLDQHAESDTSSSTDCE